jgi:hypothetical protein
MDGRGRKPMGLAFGWTRAGGIAILQHPEMPQQRIDGNFGYNYL